MEIDFVYKILLKKPEKFEKITCISMKSVLL